MKLNLTIKEFFWTIHSLFLVALSGRLPDWYLKQKKKRKKKKEKARGGWRLGHPLFFCFEFEFEFFLKNKYKHIML